MASHLIYCSRLLYRISTLDSDLRNKRRAVFQLRDGMYPQIGWLMPRYEAGQICLP